MSGLAASRWASTPVQEEEKQKPTVTAKEEIVAEQMKPVEISIVAEAVRVEKPASEAVAALDDATRESVEEQVERQPHAIAQDEQSKLERGAPVAEKQGPDIVSAQSESTSWADDVEQSLAVAEPSSDQQASDRAKEQTAQQSIPSHTEVASPVVVASPTLELPKDASSFEPHGNATTQDSGLIEEAPAAQPFRLEPPRLKKRISGMDRKYMINIPNIDFSAFGMPMPMTLEESRERIAQLDATISSLSTDDNSGSVTSTAHVRPIYPEEQETRGLRKGQRPVVSLPDLNAWKNYESALVEAKLAALGVGLSDDAPSSHTEDMSRQTSSTYPGTFSPPVPTGSANGMRPAFVRGHSHTMSVASPITVGNGPFGHMHRHSTFHGFSPLQTQDLGRQIGLGGPRSFSPVSPYNMSAIPQIASPAQFNALRNDYGLIRGPGSPLSHSMTPDPNDFHRQRLQSMIQQPPLPPTYVPQRSFTEQISALPELPEDEDEEELSDPLPYVPPHKRAHVNDDIVVPTPRHRHNISENLEREVLQSEQQREADAQNANGRANSFGQAPKLFGQVSDLVPAEKDPLSGGYSVLESGHRHKRSGSRFNVAAPAFTFNPAATFKPGSSGFTFGGQADRKPNHTRQVSSGTFNVSAPEFKPSASVDGPPPPSSDFNFSTKGPAFNSAAPAFVPPAIPEKNIIDQLPSIFGKVDIPDIIKPVKKSKAITIVRPSETSDRSASATEADDHEGRPVRGKDRQKRSRKTEGDSGDEVPLFAPSPANPSAAIKVLPSQPAHLFHVDEKPLPELPKEGDSAVEAAPSHDDHLEQSDHIRDKTSASPSPTKHKANISSLSALAQPWQPPSTQSNIGVRPDTSEVVSTQEPISDLEDRELHDDLDVNAIREPPAPPATIYPSFDEIDAVMQHLNAKDDTEPSAPVEDAYEPLDGVQYLSTWPRSDAPSPSPERKQISRLPSPSAQLDIIKQNNTDSLIWPEVNRLNKAPGPPSDWSDMLTPAEDEKLQARSSFFDNRIDDVVGRVLADRLKPFEDALQNIQFTLRKAAPVERRPSRHRSSSAIESDADDEDDEDSPRHRPISRGRDDKLAHIKSIVLEALREQSPQRSQSAYDIADLHGALADMKMSFARAASSSLELDDIRAIVEDVVARQPPLPPASAAAAALLDEPESANHKRELAELEARLNETLSNALEQANRMHEVEQREAETRRMLKLAEEEVRLLREDNQDDDSRVRAFESERVALLERIDAAKDAQAKAEDHSETLQAENEALQATLEEYRLSSKKWRQAAEEHKNERETLQGTVTALERQIQDTQDSGSGIRRRLEKLHSDMATASGQLASEKNRWKAREEKFRAQCEALEGQVATTTREKLQLDEEIRMLHIRAAEVDSAKQAFDGLRFTNASLDEMIRSLRDELHASQALAAQQEHDLKELRETSRTEVQRTQLSLQLDVEAANHRVNLVRAELESEVARAHAELDSVKLEADTAKEKHALLLEEEVEIRAAELQKINNASLAALDEARHKYEGAIRELTQQHSRSLGHAIEDKERSEYLLNERLVLADSKLQHFQDKILHLEERVEVAKSAAQAAALSAQGSKAVPSPRPRSNALPEKISPQALRESILVLQEQLQERETTIEKMQQTLKSNGPAKIKECDSEIAWLRELLTVRGEELTDLVNTLSKPTFDRDTVRDTAIRIRANLDMEQQEKERLRGAPLSAGQAIASLSNFATPKAVQLTSAFNKWRTSMESSALKSRAASASSNRSATPSRAPSGGKGTYSLSGLMTPPTSNLRSSPTPEATSTVPAPKLSVRRESRAQKDKKIGVDAPMQAVSQDNEPPSTPNLFGSGHYDDDAEDRGGDMPSLEDDDLNIADSEPPAFRSLEEELGEPTAVGPET